MKKVSKKLLNLAIENCRKYWETPLEDCEEYLDEWQKASIEIGKKTNTSWCSWKELLGSLLSTFGLNNTLTNEQIYEILKFIGWEVVDE